MGVQRRPAACSESVMSSLPHGPAYEAGQSTGMDRVFTKKEPVDRKAPRAEGGMSHHDDPLDEYEDMAVVLPTAHFSFTFDKARESSSAAVKEKEDLPFNPLRNMSN